MHQKSENPSKKVESATGRFIKRRTRHKSAVGICTKTPKTGKKYCRYLHPKSENPSKNNWLEMTIIRRWNILLLPKWVYRRRHARAIDLSKKIRKRTIYVFCIARFVQTEFPVTIWKYVKCRKSEQKQVLWIPEGTHPKHYAHSVYRQHTDTDPQTAWSPDLGTWESAWAWIWCGLVGGKQVMQAPVGCGRVRSKIDREIQAHTFETASSRHRL